MTPFRAAVLGDCDVVCAVKDGRHAVYAQEVSSQRARVRRLQSCAWRQILQESRGEVLRQHACVRLEFEGLYLLSVIARRYGKTLTYIGIGSVFSLNKECPAANAGRAQRRDLKT